MTQVLYVLGSTRSGTSAIRNALSQTRYKGYGEGHLVPILAEFLQVVRQHATTGLGANVPGNGLHNLKENVFIRHLFHGYESYLSEMFQTDRIMDKTPTVVPIRIAADLNTFHQDARFIHCSRRHVDNVKSKLKKFPDKNVQQHSAEWAECNAVWLDVKTRLGDNFVAFDFYDLVTDQAGTAERIGTYLGLERDEINAMTEYFLSQRPEGQANRDLTDFFKLSDMDWSEEEKSDFEEICGPVGKRLGYGFETYFAAEKTPSAESGAHGSGSGSGSGDARPDETQPATAEPASADEERRGGTASAA